MDILESQKEVLVKAKDLVSKGWMQGYYASDKDKQACSFLSSEACNFCITGAIYASLPKNTQGTPVYRLEKIVGGVVPVWNDHPDRTQAEVISLFDRVIEEIDEEIKAQNVVQA